MVVRRRRAEGAGREDSGGGGECGSEFGRGGCGLYCGGFGGREGKGSF